MTFCLISFDVQADGAEAEDEREWTRSFVYMMKKLCLRNELVRDTSTATATATAARQRLLIKSPVHTARIPLLRKIFPKAKFIYIHRHPDEVLLSMAHMLDTTYWYCYLNTPTDEQIQEFILWQFEHMWYKYDAAATATAAPPTSSSQTTTAGQRREVSADILEISYDSTTAHLKRAIQDVYGHVGIPWTDELEAHFLAEEKLLTSYRPNVHNESLLSDEIKTLIRNRWGPYFDAFNYK
jgi:omega-hydroxy-beta-dihydromenaquinone-9 sulfotransferase